MRLVCIKQQSPCVDYQAIFPEWKWLLLHDGGKKGSETTAKIGTSLFLMTCYWQCNIIVVMSHKCTRTCIRTCTRTRIVRIRTWWKKWKSTHQFQYFVVSTSFFFFTKFRSWLINGCFQSPPYLCFSIEWRLLPCNINEKVDKSAEWHGIVLRIARLRNTKNNDYVT